MRRATLTWLALLGGCAVGEAQPPRPPVEMRCRVDADCVVVTQMPNCGPCGGCRGAPRALSRRWVDAEARACGAQRRAEARRARDAERRGQPARRPPNCEPCREPPESASWTWAATCNANACEAHVVDAASGELAP